MANDLWRDCAAWLTRCKIISTEYRVNQPGSDIKVLATILRDGVLLCNLVDFFDSLSFESKEFIRKPQMAHFLCIHNIKLFVDACRTKFRLREADLFEPTMLYDLSNFHRVLITLSKLSNCRKVQTSHNIPGFKLQPEEGETTDSNSDIYNGLAESASYPADYGDQHDLRIKEVYQNLVELPTLLVCPGRIERRAHVINEIIETERTYVKNLYDLKQIFMRPLKKLLNKQQMETIFPCIKRLAKIHKRFLDRLVETEHPNVELKIGTVFIEFHKQFLIYGDFCSYLPNAIETFEAICRRTLIVQQTIAQCEREYQENRFHLKDLLCVPMQRMLKYPLLLDTLVRETAPTHEDFCGLEVAKDSIKDVADYTNKSKGDAEHLAVIEKAKNSIVNLTLPPGRNLHDYGRLLVDGDLVIKMSKDPTVKHWYAFLFEKLMILTENRSSNNNLEHIEYYFHQTCDLSDCIIEETEPRSNSTVPPNVRRHALLLTRQDQELCAIYMKTAEEREKWKRAIGTAIETLAPVGCKSTDHTYYIHTFTKPVICQHCSKYLKGRIHQGYKCINCEAIAHKGCVSSTGRCKQLQLTKSALCEYLMSQYNWYVGTMDREYTEELLMSKQIGTYLVRARPHGASHATETIYAISLKANNSTINHMKIYKKKRLDDTVYYLAVRYFKKITELVSYYEQNTLSENFSGLNETLQWPVKEEIVVSLYDYSPTEDNQLQLFQGSQVIVIGKEKDSLGWWYGKTSVKVGFFPKNYVRAVNSDEM